MKFLVVGAGLTGSVIARNLADASYFCHVIDEAPHVAGNCHTQRDHRTGILMHSFGPHTLHTDSELIWQFIQRFVEIKPYRHRKQAWIKGELYPFPINLDAINQLFGKSLKEGEAACFIAERAAKFVFDFPKNFEEAALASIGQELYEAYYKGYTFKQWGRPPSELPAFIFRRLPVHLNNDTNVFHHSRQGQPVGGYTQLVENILDHPRINLDLNLSFEKVANTKLYDHIFYSGPIDRFFGWSHGHLPYRTLDFKHEHRSGTFQNCGTVNYCDEDVPYTRVAEHKHFWPWEQHPDTVITYEYSRECNPDDRPYYPVRSEKGIAHFKEYATCAENIENVSFAGRLGTYRYLDMDRAIDEAMNAAKTTISAISTGRKIPKFFFS